MFIKYLNFIFKRIFVHYFRNYKREHNEIKEILFKDWLVDHLYIITI